MEREKVKQVLGKAINTGRKAHNVSQKELADYLGITKSSISRYESGKMEIPASYLPLISDYCKFPLRDYVIKLEAHREIEKLSGRYELERDVVIPPTIQERLAEYMSQPEQQDALTVMENLSEMKAQYPDNEWLQVQLDKFTDAVIELVISEVQEENFKKRLKKYYSMMKQMSNEANGKT